MMMKLTLVDERSIWVNPYSVQSIVENQTFFGGRFKDTSITTDGDYWLVQERAKVIVEMMEYALEKAKGVL